MSKSTQLIDFIKAFFLPRTISQKGLKGFIHTLEAKDHPLLNMESMERFFLHSIHSTMSKKDPIKINVPFQYEVTITERATNKRNIINFTYYIENELLGSSVPSHFIEEIEEKIEKRFNKKDYEVNVTLGEGRDEASEYKFLSMKKFISHSFYMDTYTPQKVDKFSVLNDKTGISKKIAKILYKNIMTEVIKHGEKQDTDFNIGQTGYKILKALSTVNFDLTYTYYKHRSIFDIFKSPDEKIIKELTLGENEYTKPEGMFSDTEFKLSKIDHDKIKALIKSKNLYDFVSACTAVVVLVSAISGALFAHAILGKNSNYKASEQFLKKALYASGICAGLTNLIRAIVDNKLTKAENAVFEEIANNLKFEDKERS